MVDDFTTLIPGLARQTKNGQGIDEERASRVLKRYVGRWVFAEMLLERMGLVYRGAKRLSGSQRRVIAKCGFRVSESYRKFPGREEETLKVRVLGNE